MSKTKIKNILGLKTRFLGMAMLGFFAFSFSGFFVHAQVTRQINFTASLMGSNGSVVADGEYDVRFALYSKDRTSTEAYPSDSDASARVWTETQKLTVKNGMIATSLGVSTPLPEQFSGSEYFLGVRIGEDSEMAPRKKLNAAFAALNALNAEKSALADVATSADSLLGKVIGTKSGDIPTLGAGGKLLVKMLPIGTGAKQLVLSGDARLHSQNTDTGTTQTSFTIGSGTGKSSASFDLSVSNDSKKPSLRYNGETSSWQFSNDGASFREMGSGSYLDLSGGVLTGNITFNVSQTFGGASLTEVGYAQGVTSNIQTQIDAKANVSHAHSAADISSGVLALERGGTGISAAPTNGQLLIGNGSGYALGTVTASDGIAVTNGSGTIAFAADVATSGTTATVASNSGLETTSQGIRMVGGCADEQVLAWNTSLGTWRCTNKTGGTSDWTDDGTNTYLSDVTSDFSLGGTTSTSSRFFFDITSGNRIVFEGTGADDTNETALVVTNPTADRTLTLPDASGTIALMSDITADNITMSGAYDYITFAGQDIVRGQIDLTTDVSGILPVANGGTGLDGSAATNGQLLIGNGTGYALATLTPGSGITVTNGAGSVTIASTLGTAIDNTEITDDTIKEADLNVTNAPTGLNGYLLSYVESTGNFQWVSPGAVGAGDITDVNTSALTGLTGGTSAGAATLAFDYSATLAGSPALAANATLFGSTGLFFEGTTADAFEGLLTLADPTADNTWTLPNLSGTLATLNGGQTFTSAVWQGTAIGNAYLDTAVILSSEIDTSAKIAGIVTDETGSGALVFATSPTLVTPVLGIASATSVNKIALTTPATGATLTIADGKTLTASNTLTFTGTDASSVAFGTGGTVAYTADNLSAFAATTSAQLAGVVSDETGTGALVFSTSPTFGGTPTFASLSSNGGPLYTNASGVLAQATAGTSAQVLHGGATPSFSAVSLTADVSGILPVANGGTGASSLTDLIALGSQTTGNYLATLTGSGTITSTGATTGEGTTHTLSVTADSIGDTQLAFTIPAST